MPIHFAMNESETDPLTDIGLYNWKRYINSSKIEQNEMYLKMLKIGKVLYEKKIKENQEKYKEKFFEKKIHDLNAIVLETEERGSLLFKGFYFKNKHDLMVRFNKSKKDGKFHMSFYTDKKNIDITKFARGHKKAAGLIVDDLNEIFEKEQ